MMTGPVGCTPCWRASWRPSKDGKAKKKEKASRAKEDGNQADPPLGSSRKEEAKDARGERRVAPR